MQTHFSYSTLGKGIFRKCFMFTLQIYKKIFDKVNILLKKVKFFIIILFNPVNSYTFAPKFNPLTIISYGKVHKRTSA